MECLPVDVTQFFRAYHVILLPCRARVCFFYRPCLRHLLGRCHRNCQYKSTHPKGGERRDDENDSVWTSLPWAKYSPREKTIWVWLTLHNIHTEIKATTVMGILSNIGKSTGNLVNVFAQKSRWCFGKISKRGLMMFPFEKNMLQIFVKIPQIHQI